MPTKKQPLKVQWVFASQPSLSLQSFVPDQIKYWHIDEKIKLPVRPGLLLIESHCFPEKIEKLLRRSTSAKFIKVLVGAEKSKDMLKLHNKYRFDHWALDDLGLEDICLSADKSMTSTVSSQSIHFQELQKVNAFIKKIESSDSVEALFTKVQEEFTKYLGVKNVFLAVEENSEGAEIWYFQKKNIVKKKTDQLWSPSTKISLNSIESQDYFVDLLKRPVGQIIAVPLLQTTEKNRKEVKAVPYVFLEHSISKEKMELFLEWMSSRIHPVSSILDNLFKKNLFKKISFQWEQIFDKLDHPMAVVDSDYNVLRGNERFKNNDRGNSAKCYQVFVDRESPCVNCPLEREGRQLIDRQLVGRQLVGQQSKEKKEIFMVDSYLLPVEAKGGHKVFVNHYLDETKSHHLKKQVIQQEKMAALGHLAGHIAHELNNPLTGIHSLAQFLEETLKEKLDGENSILSDLKEVKESSRRCHQIVKNLLGFGRGEEKKKVVDLNEVTEKALQLVKTAMSHHQRDFVFSQEPLNLKAEPHLLQQVIFNLINNACQAMSKPGTLNIETKSDEQFCYLRIRDSGPGIPENLKDKIFDPFFTTKERGKGTGLGLSMSLEIIKKFDGSLKLNEVSAGAEFEIALPKVVL